MISILPKIRTLLPLQKQEANLCCCSRDFSSMILAGPPFSLPLASFLFVVNVGLQSTTGVLSSSSLLSTETFDFGNGSSVLVENPLQVKGLSMLENPKLLGVGGGGAVFSYHRQASTQPNPSRNQENQQDKVVVKFSWLQSADSVRNECNILKILEQRRVSGVERCLAQFDYPQNSRRTVIVMEPVVEDGVNSVDVLSPKAAATATEMLMKTMAQMLAARVVTADVQPLISKSTGNVILIDMTEAILLPEGKLSDVNRAFVNEFCAEMLTLIPDGWEKVAAETFHEEVYRLEAESDIRFDDEVRSIVESLVPTG